jgi:thiol-disulfide isomerase/thioredoxin
MKLFAFGLACYAIFAVLSNADRSAAQVPPLDGLSLLERTASTYASAKSYHIEAVVETSDESEFSKYWEKSVLSAAEAPGGRLRYESHSPGGGALRVSDGKVIWIYHVEENLYTQQPASSADPAVRKGIPDSEIALAEALGLRKTLSEIAQHYKSATRLPNETLRQGSQQVDCYVVRVQTVDLKQAKPGDSLEKMFWIDANRFTVIKTIEHRHSNAQAGAARIPFEVETSATYSLVELDAAVASSLFVFSPPAAARRVDKFPNTVANAGGKDLTGQSIPPIALKSAGGEVVQLDSFRGKPILLETWGTWCAPCVKRLATLATIYGEAKNKGMVFISIDEDEDPETARALLAEKKYDWPNFHDVNWEISEILGWSGVPRTILVDGLGKVVFDRFQYSENELRAAIGKLGPDYASVAKAKRATATN